jgi:hypothetical protein
MAPSSSPWKKIILKYSVNGQGNDHCPIGLLRIILVDAPRGETVKYDAYNRTLTDSGSVSNEFSLKRTQQKS